MQDEITTKTQAHNFSEKAEQYRYLRTVTNQNSIQEEIMRRSSLENVCYHSVQDLLSSRLLPKYIKI